MPTQNLVEVVTVADVDAEDRVGNHFLKIWELAFGPKAKLLFNGQEFEVEVQAKL